MTTKNAMRNLGTGTWVSRDGQFAALRGMRGGWVICARTEPVDGEPLKLSAPIARVATFEAVGGAIEILSARSEAR